MKFRAVTELGRVGCEQVLDALAQDDRDRLAELHEWVQRRSFKHLYSQPKAIQQPSIEKGTEVDDLVAQPHPGTGIEVSRRENAKWQVGEGEIVPLRHLNPRGQVRVCHGAKVVHDGGFVGACHGRAT